MTIQSELLGARIPAGTGTELKGDLIIPDQAAGVVLFAHGSRSSRQSPRNRYVASVLQQYRLATLLIDLLTPQEEEEERDTAHLRFDIDFLAKRLEGIARWLAPATGDLPLGLFGSSTGAAAAFMAAAHMPNRVLAVVSRGGRPDLAGLSIGWVRSATLLIVGSDDPVVLQINRDAFVELNKGAKQFEVVPGAGHLFSEPGTLEQVGELTARWFDRYLG